MECLFCAEWLCLEAYVKFNTHNKSIWTVIWPMILDEKIEVHNTSEDLGFESRSLCPLSFITTVVHISFRIYSCDYVPWLLLQIYISAHQWFSVMQPSVLCGMVWKAADKQVKLLKVFYLYTTRAGFILHYQGTKLPRVE